MDAEHVSDPGDCVIMDLLSAVDCGDMKTRPDRSDLKQHSDFDDGECLPGICGEVHSDGQSHAIDVDDSSTKDNFLEELSHFSWELNISPENESHQLNEKGMNTMSMELEYLMNESSNEFIFEGNSYQSSNTMSLENNDVNGDWCKSWMKSDLQMGDDVSNSMPHMNKDAVCDVDCMFSLYDSMQTKDHKGVVVEEPTLLDYLQDMSFNMNESSLSHNSNKPMMMEPPARKNMFSKSKTSCAGAGAPFSSVMAANFSAVNSRRPESGPVISTPPSCQVPEAPRPGYTYVVMVARVLLAADNVRLTIAQIREGMMDMYPYFRQQKTKRWESSMRHVLSASACFLKHRQADRKQKLQWTLHPASADLLRNGVFNTSELNSAASGKKKPKVKDTSYGMAEKKRVKSSYGQNAWCDNIKTTSATSTIRHSPVVFFSPSHVNLTTAGDVPAQTVCMPVQSMPFVRLVIQPKQDTI